MYKYRTNHINLPTLIQSVIMCVLCFPARQHADSYVLSETKEVVSWFMKIGLTGEIAMKTGAILFSSVG